MIIDILTLFPEAFSYLDSSIIKRAKEQGLLEINIIDIRDFSKNKHKKCDDYPFGGGAGMLMSVEPVYYAVKSVQKDNSIILLPSPSGKVLNGEIVRNLAKEEHLIFICGHYEGIDQRVIDIFNPTEISVGELIDTIEYDYPTFHLSMDCFWCEVIKGNLVLKEAEDAKWLKKNELDKVDWLPADVELIGKIGMGQ